MTILQNKKMRFMIAFFFLTLFFHTTDLWAFSLGSIKIETSFKESLYAEVPVFMDASLPLSVQVGTEADYKQIGLERKSVVDKISVQIMTGKNKIPFIKITSATPLSHPPFQLVLKCFYNDGAILRNFLINRDYPKSLVSNTATPKGTPSKVAPPKVAPIKVVPIKAAPGWKARVKPRVLKATPVKATPKAFKNYSISLLPYYGITNHSGANNSDGSTIGLYSYIGYDKHSLELEFDKFKNDSNVKQNDTIASYTYYGIPKWHLKGGYHQIGQVLQEGRMFITGLGFSQYNLYGYKTWSSGLQYYHTSYEDSLNLNTQQISPYFSYNHAFKALSGYSTFKILLNHIIMSETLYRDSTFTSAKAIFSQHWKRISMTLSGWGGKSSYVVGNDGFLLFNTPDVLKSGFGFSSTWRMTSKFSLKGSFEQYNFTSWVDGSNSNFQRFNIYLGASF